MFTRQGLVDYADLPALDEMRAQVLSTLKSHSQQTYQLLQQQQNTLSQYLTQKKKKK